MASEMNPFKIFRQWYSEAEASEASYPDSMALATMGSDGMPDVRIVLLKKFSEEGLVFYTNYESKKARDISSCPNGTLNFHWKSLKRQIRVSGVLSKTSAEDSDAYFATRPRLSQIGAWASRQSEPMESEYDIEKRVAEFTLKFHIGKVPRPPHWGGYCLKPLLFEFWEDRPARIHRRRQFVEKDGQWVYSPLFP